MSILTKSSLKHILVMISNKYKDIICQDSDIQGGIESITAGSISGWVLNMDQEKPIEKVILLSGNKVINSCKVNIMRNDVSEKFNYNNETGFILELPPSVNKNITINKVSIIAFGSDKKTKKELKLFGKSYRKTINTIIEILKSPHIGKIGHVDGIKDDGTIHGWAARYNDKDSIKIWIQAENLKPQQIFCDQWREGLCERELSGHSGFIIEPYSLQEEYSQKSIYFSFDKEGKYRIPQPNNINLPNLYDIKISQKQYILENINQIDYSNMNNILEFNKIEKYWEQLTKIKNDIKLAEKKIIKENKLYNYFTKVIKQLKGFS